MNIEVWLHPPYDRAVGSRVLTVELPDGGTLSDLLERLRRDYPGLFPRLRETDREEEIRAFVLFVAAGEVQPLTRRLQDGDRIDLYPPLSGGAESVPNLVQTH